MISQPLDYQAIETYSCERNDYNLYVILYINCVKWLQFDILVHAILNLRKKIMEVITFESEAFKAIMSKLARVYELSKIESIIYS